MRSTDFPFAVMPQGYAVRRFKEGGPSFAARYLEPTIDDDFGREALDIVGRDTLAALPVSGRDRLIDQLAVMIGRPNAKRVVDGVASIADFTPAGAVSALDESVLALKKGNRGEAAANLLLGVLPVPGPVKKAVKGAAGKAAKAIKGAGKPDAPTLAVKPDVVEPLAARPRIAIRTKPSGIIAYHGSPHTFDRFDMSKIGTGEGAQAYGHGLYFAENESVAKDYRDALANTVNYRGGGYPKVFYESDLAAKKVADSMRRGSNPADVIAEEIMKFRTAAENVRSRSNRYKYYDAGIKEIDERLAQTYDKMISDLKKLNPEDFSFNTGSMYKVNIDADKDNFLNYDTPLLSQPLSVRRGVAETFGAGEDPLIRELIGDIEEPEALQFLGLLPGSKGSQAYGTLKYNLKPVGFNEKGEGLFDAMVALDKQDAAGASNKLFKAGIPGIKYLDRGSRGAGAGTSNFVVFDDELVNILKRYRDGGLAVKKKKKPRVSKRKALPQSSPNSSM